MKYSLIFLCIIIMSCNRNHIYYTRYSGKEYSISGALVDYEELDTTKYPNDSIAYCKAYEHYRVKNNAYSAMYAKTQNKALYRQFDTFFVFDEKQVPVYCSIPNQLSEYLGKFNEDEYNRITNSK